MALLIAFVTFIVAGLICLLIWFSLSVDSDQQVEQRAGSEPDDDEVDVVNQA